MALQDTDLFVIQSQDDNQLYKLRLDSLKAEIAGGAGVNFKGAADLNNPPATSGVTLPADNGDLYMVESDAAAIDSGWVMQNSDTSATKGDRIIYDGDNANWILISSGSSTAGTVTGVTASLPLISDGDSVTPVISSREATTTLSGHVARLAIQDDVKHTDGTGASDAVVTANLLKATNDIVEGLAVAAGGVTTVTSADVNGNSALTINPTTGNVVIEIKNSSTTDYGVVQLATPTDITNGTAGAAAVVDASHLKDVKDEIDALDTGVTSVTTTDANGNSALTINPTTGDAVVEIATSSNAAYGVVQIASASDIANGTAGASAVVDASQLKNAVDSIPPAGVQSLTEGGTDVVTGALQITTNGDGDTTIGVNEEVFCPFDFSALNDITTV